RVRIMISSLRLASLLCGFADRAPAPNSYLDEAFYWYTRIKGRATREAAARGAKGHADRDKGPYGPRGTRRRGRHRSRPQRAAAGLRRSAREDPDGAIGARRLDQRTLARRLARRLAHAHSRGDQSPLRQ